MTKSATVCLASPPICVTLPVSLVLIGLGIYWLIEAATRPQNPRS